MTAKDFSFGKTAIDASIGILITFKLSNKGSARHTLTVYTDYAYTNAVEGADTGTVVAGMGGEFTTIFDKAGDYYFHCNIHPTQMKGEIAVK